MKNKTTIFALFVVVVVSIGAVRSFLEFAEQDETNQGFNSQIPGYLNEPLKESKQVTPYRSDSVLMVDVKNATVDYWTHSRLPEAIMAESPDKVGTIVFIDWIEEKIGTYQDQETGETTGSAYKLSANVRLVDWNKRTVIDEKYFEGKPPPEAITSTGDYGYHRPMFEIVDYTKGLPAR